MEVTRHRASHIIFADDTRAAITSMTDILIVSSSRDFADGFTLNVAKIDERILFSAFQLGVSYICPSF